MINAADGFGCNKEAFLQIVAFTLLRTWRSTEDEEAAEESKYLCIRSKERSIGKTTALRMLAMMHGIPNQKHPLFLNAGNGSTSGTTSILQKKTLTLTNNIVFFNEVALESTNANTYNNTHDQFYSGNSRTGLMEYRASIICTSNSKEHDLLDGRMLFVEFHKGIFNDVQYKQLRDVLMPHLKENKGLAIAWVYHYKKLFGAKRLEKLQFWCHGIVTKYIKSQRRHSWVKSSKLIFLYMLNLSAGIEVDFMDTFEKVVFPEKLASMNSTVSIIGDNLKIALDEKKELLTWMNPVLTFKDTNEVEVEALAIRSNKIRDIIPLPQLKDFLHDYGHRAWNKTAFFSVRSDGTIKDLNSKSKNSKAEKSYKLPYKALQADVVELVQKEFNLERKHIGIQKSPDCSISDADADNLCKMYRYIKAFMNATIVESNADSDDNMSKKLSPILSRKYKDMTPESRDIFTMGYERAMLDLAVARTEPVVVNERGTKRKLDLTKTSEKGTKKVDENPTN